MLSGDGLFCLLELSVFFGVAAGVMTGDGLGLMVIVEGKRWPLADETVMRAYFKVIIFEGEGDEDIRTAGGVMMCCLGDGEDGAENLGADFFL